MNIRWTAEAVANLENISLHIAEDNLAAAYKTVNTIYEQIEGLVVFPNRARKGREAGTRELVLAPLPYIVIYVPIILPSKFCTSITERRIGVDGFFGGSRLL